MVKTFYALSDRSVNQFKQFLRNTQPVSGETASPLQIRMKFVKLTEAAPAAATDDHCCECYSAYYTEDHPHLASQLPPDRLIDLFPHPGNAFLMHLN